jgi:hypothetical protein
MFVLLSASAALGSTACQRANEATDEGADLSDLTQDDSGDSAADSSSADDSNQSSNASTDPLDSSDEESSDADTSMSDDPGDSQDEETPHFDLANLPDLGDDNALDFSYIWIANTAEGTLSKIDTRLAVELARYRTGPAGVTLEPSRTSVSLSGEAVVANRGTGTVVRFSATPAGCIDRNGDGKIQTSQGPSDLLDWESDECMLWSTNPGFTGGSGGSRALAWDFAQTNGIDDPNVWVGFCNGESDAHLVRLNGESGEVEADIPVAAWNQVYNQGVYGGAIVPNGDFWAIGKGGAVVHADATNLVAQRWNFPPPAGTQETFYGMTVDPQGDLWMAGQSGHLYEFEIATANLQVRAMGLGGSLQGVSMDDEGVLWIASRQPCAIKRFDTIAGVMLDPEIVPPGCIEPIGTSIDIDGMAWVVDKSANAAYRIDPQTLDVVTVSGLVAPYTYSDMTGGALRSVIPPK